MTASDDELRRYGYPARPTSNKADEQDFWTKRFSSYVRMDEPGTCAVAGIYSNGNFSSTNWSGIIDSQPTNDYRAIVGEYIEPTYQSLCNGASATSTWVGLGGIYAGSQTLTQAGTDNYGSASLNSGRYSFYEYLGPAGSVTEQHFAGQLINQGDQIVASVDWGSGVPQFTVTNQTTGNTRSVGVPLATSYLDGRSAEWVSERPSVYGVPVLLRNFGAINWDYATAAKSNGVNGFMGNWGNTGNITMIAPSHVIAGPTHGISSPRSFADYWLACN